MGADSPDDFRGMTINERLVMSGLMDEYEQAASIRDAERMVSILVRTHLPKAAAEATVKAILANPGFYGY